MEVTLVSSVNDCTAIKMAKLKWTLWGLNPRPHAAYIRFNPLRVKPNAKQARYHCAKCPVVVRVPVKIVWYSWCVHL